MYQQQRHQHDKYTRDCRYEPSQQEHFSLIELTLTGCFTESIAVKRDVSLTSDGLPSRDSMYRAATPVPNFAEYTPTARREIPAACKRKGWVLSIRQNMLLL